MTICVSLKPFCSQNHEVKLHKSILVLKKWTGIPTTTEKKPNPFLVFDIFENVIIFPGWTARQNSVKSRLWLALVHRVCVLTFVKQLDDLEQNEPL